MSHQWVQANKFCIRRRLGFGIVCLWLLTQAPTPSHGVESSHDPHAKNYSTLNIRLSSKVIRPPQELIMGTLTITHMAIAKPIVGPPSKSAILEDDHRHRLIILTSEDNGNLTAYMLDQIDLRPHLSDLRARVLNRGCGRDRMTITGGLGCVALCVKEIMESNMFP